MTTECAPHPIVAVFDYFNTLRLETKPTKPWLLDVAGESWLFATEGHLLVAVRGDASLGEPVPHKYLKAEKYLSPLDNCRSVLLADLVKFAGRAPVPLPSGCVDCHGTGWQDSSDLITCEHCGQCTRLPCDSCDGEGRVSTSLPMRYGRFNSHEPFNVGYLAFALSIVPLRDVVAVGHMSFGEHREAVIVDGGEWRIAIMNVLVHDSLSDSVSVFNLPLAADAVDPHADHSGKPSTRVKESS